MIPSDLHQIQSFLAPRLASGELSLLLGSGFSLTNRTPTHKIPGSDELRDAILAECGKTAGPRTTLKDAYVLGSREIATFLEFLREQFTVDVCHPWQQAIFAHVWKRIYTTNIDNVLNVAHHEQGRIGKLSCEFKFFNYNDPSLVSESIGATPVVTIHGTCSRLEDGFIFSSLEYAKATAKVHDWHRDLAAKALTGGLVVVGNQLDESDFDSYISQRELAYPHGTPPVNWIVMPNPDPIKADNYRAAGYHVIDATAEDFFTELFHATTPRSIADIVIETIPAVRDRITNLRAMTWFRGSMRPVLTEIENARLETGILRNFIFGAEPTWFYVVQSAHAETSRNADLTREIGRLMADNATGIGVLHVIGPSGSGKSTAIRAALKNVVGTYPYSYEFENGSGLDTELLRETINQFTEKSLFVFYSAAEFYYAIGYICDHFRGKRNPFCLFVLEDRSGDFAKNRRQLKKPDVSSTFPLEDLSDADAGSIALRIENHGLNFPNFSEYSIARRSKIIVDKERGFSGDLLTTLFSLTTHQNFQEKIHQDYFSIRGETPRNALEVVAIINSLGFDVPIGYLAGMLGKSLPEVHKLLEEDLAGVVLYLRRQEAVRCRHRIIADFYFNECIAKHGSSELILGILEFLSRQFTVADIRHHPLPYRIYKEIVSFEFLFDRYFSENSRLASTEVVYHECQKWFGTDGIFWLHFGRFYRKTDRIDEAIESFRTGLEYYESYQTRHQLGVALLERYLGDGCSDIEDYRDGIETLEIERTNRGTTDSYPTGTMIAWLLSVVEKCPTNEDARDRLKNCVNYGLRYFNDDQYVKRQIGRYFEVTGATRA
jgi:hypothetical protein